MKTKGLALACVLLTWTVGTPLACGQGKTSVQLDSVGNPELRGAAEENVSAVITELNRAALFGERPDLSDVPVTDRGREALLSRWEEDPFYCNQTELTRSLVQGEGGTYEIRDIPLIVGGEEQQDGVLSLTAEGEVRGFRYGNEPTTGTITIAAEPSGATVVSAIGDTSTQAAPARFSEVPEGRYEFTIRKESYQTVDTTLAVTAGQTQTVSVRLERKRVPFRVRTDPAGATVFVNGDSIGTAPLDSTLVAGRTYTLRVDEAHHVPSRQMRIVADPDSAIERTVVLSSVDVQAEDGDVQLRNVEVSRSDEFVDVTYDLRGDTEETYEVELSVVGRDGEPVEIDAEDVTGAVGEGVAPGPDKKITWRAALPEGATVQLAAQTQGGGRRLLYVVGIAVAGGVLAAILLGGGSGGDGGYLTPSGPPGN